MFQFVKIKDLISNLNQFDPEISIYIDLTNLFTFCRLPNDNSRTRSLTNERLRAEKMHESSGNDPGTREI